MTDRTVKVRLEAMIGQYEAAMAKAGLSTKSFGHTVDSLGRGTEKSFKSMALNAMTVGKSTAGIAAGVAIAGVALAKFTKDGVESYVHLVDEVKAYKNVAGSSAEQSSEMVAVAHALGVEVDSLARGMFRLSHNVAVNTDKLQAQGVVVAKTKGGHVDLTKTLLNVADAYQRAGGAAGGGNQVAEAAFGMRAAQSMIPILKQGRAEIERYVAAARAHQQIVTQDDLDKVFEYKVGLRELNEAWTGMERELGKGAIPMMTTTAELMTSLIEKADKLAHLVAHPIPIVGSLPRVAGAGLRDLPGVGLSMDVARGHWKSAALDIIPFSNSVRLLFGHHKKAADGARLQAEADQRLADQIAKDRQEVDDYIGSLKTLASSFDVADAQGRFNTDLAEFADKVRAAQLAGDAYATSLDESTATGHKNAEMVRGLTKDIFDTAEAARKSGADVEGATAVQRAALENVLEQLGVNKAEAQRYADVLERLGAMDVTGKIDLDTSRAEAKLQELRNQYAFLNPNTSEAHNQYDFLNPAHPASPPASTTAALEGEGPEAKAERERQAAAAKAAADERQRAADDRKRAAEDAARAADEARKRAETVTDNAFDLGMYRLDDYLRELDRRQAQYAELTPEWMAIHDRRLEVMQRYAAGLDAVQAHNRMIEDNMFKVGKTTKDEYLAMLQKRLDGLQQYSDEWTAIWEQIKQLKGETDRNIVDIIEAVDKQRQRDIAWYEAAPQRQLTAARESTSIDYRQRPGWMRDALCLEHPEIDWFPTGLDADAIGAARAAKAICARCLVRDECLERALDLGDLCEGIWGGTNRRARQRIRAARRAA